MNPQMIAKDNSNQISPNLVTLALSKQKIGFKNWLQSFRQLDELMKHSLICLLLIDCLLIVFRLVEGVIIIMDVTDRGNDIQTIHCIAPCIGSSSLTYMPTSRTYIQTYPR